MAALRIDRLHDRRTINRILHDPWIEPKLRQDGRPVGYASHPLLTYHGAYSDDELVGLFIAVRFTRWETEVHAALLRPALPHARELGRLFLAHVFATPEVNRATAYVLGTLPSAVNYCRRLGLRDEGCRRGATMIDGKATDVIVLGLTRADWLAEPSRIV